MFIISKRNFKVRRADGSSYLIRKDYVGEIPQDVFESGLVQGAIKGGLIAAPAGSGDRQLERADKEAAEKEAKGDIRSDAEEAAEKEGNVSKEAASEEIPEEAEKKRNGRKR